MIIAQQPTPDPITAWTVVLTIGVLLNIAVSLVAIMRSNRAQKRQVSFEFEPAAKIDFDSHIAANDREFRAISAARSSDLAESNDSRRRLYEKIDNVRAELSAKIEGMPGRIVTDILNAKQLWREK